MKTNRKVTTPALRSDVIVDFIFEDGVLFVALCNLELGQVVAIDRVHFGCPPF